MPDIDRAEKLIVTLGQRINEQNDILRMIAANLEGIESHLRQMAISSNTAPNYQRLLSEYPTFDWSSVGATVGYPLPAPRRCSRMFGRGDLAAGLVCL
jgi:hypothetical protein